MKFEVYCDEANPDVLTSANPRARYLMIGSLWLPEELTQFISTPSFPAGTSWKYSNTNYLLLLDLFFL